MQTLAKYGSGVAVDHLYRPLRNYEHSCDALGTAAERLIFQAAPHDGAAAA
jgi:hypothetical protein